MSSAPLNRWASRALRPLEPLFAALDDCNVDDDLLRHLVSTLHASWGRLTGSAVLSGGMTMMAWEMTRDQVFLAYFAANVVIALGRFYLLYRYADAARGQDLRATILLYDEAFSFWAMLYSLILGLTCYSLAAQPANADTLPLALAACAGYTMGYVTRSSGRLCILVRQTLATTLPLIFAFLTLPNVHGGVYAIGLTGLIVATVLMGAGANARIIELFRANQTNQRLARIDTLTGLTNRFSFQHALDSALADDADERFAVVTIDLDRFKEINDTLGHGAGDRVIVEMAARLRDVAGPSDVVARLGGDEFVILARAGAHDPAFGLHLAQRAVAALSRPYAIDDTLLPASASVGVAMFPDHGATGEELMKNADIALYEAKRAGRNQACVFDAFMQSKLAAARVLEGEIESALANNEFEAWFQPIQNIATSRIIGYEALARWRHPVHGLIPPSRFVPIAEQSGAIVALGEQILEKACAAAAIWGSGLTVAVNLSPGQFAEPARLVGAIKATLARTRLSPSRLYIEITESLLIEDTPQTRAAIDELSALGVKFSLDDFGAGYSSLSYIQSYAFSKIKIDKKFIDKVDTDSPSTAIIAAVCVLAERTKMDIVAEGVETKVQHAALRNLGITMAQGYLYGRPAPDIVLPRLRLVTSR